MARYETRPHPSREDRYIDRYVVFDTGIGKAVVWAGTGKSPAEDSLTLEAATELTAIINTSYENWLASAKEPVKIDV